MRFSNAALLPRPLLAPDGSALGLAAPVFDVKVSAQRRSAYSRLSQNELAMELCRLGLFEPGREQQASECLELMDFDGKDELLRRLDALGKLRARIDALERDKAVMLGILEKLRANSEFGVRNSESAGVGEGLAPPAVGAASASAGRASPAPTDPGALPAARAATAEAVLP